ARLAGDADDPARVVFVRHRCGRARYRVAQVVAHAAPRLAARYGVALTGDRRVARRPHALRRPLRFRTRPRPRAGEARVAPVVRTQLLGQDPRTDRREPRLARVPG